MNFFRRRKFLVNKGIQIKYVLLTILLLVSYTFVLLSAIFAPYVIAMLSDLPFPEKAAAAEVILVLHSNIWPGIGVLIVLCGIYSIFITHKLAGPVFAFNRMAVKVRKGDLSLRVNLRKGDDLHDVAESFNSVVDDIECMLSRLNEEEKKLSSYISTLERELVTRSVPEEELIRIEKEMEADKEGIRHIIGRYHFRARGPCFNSETEEKDA
jgi:methyl-accepting chemotaxis protein